MKFIHHPLPYANDALAPVISQQTVEYHYDKHQRAYIDNLNHLIEDTSYADMLLEDIITSAEGAILNNAAQAWNHQFYFFQFSPHPHDLGDSMLKHQICRQYGSLSEMKIKMEEAGVKLFGSGWVWLCCDEVGDLFITQTSNAENPIRVGLTPLLTIDVWEHAYYIDYRNRRGEYLSKIWDIIDWSVVESRYM